MSAGGVMSDYNLFLHLGSRRRFCTDTQIAFMLQRVFGWDFKACKEVAVELPKGPQVILTAPWEKVEHYAQIISQQGAWGYKVSIQPVAGSAGRRMIISKGPCFLGKISKTPCGGRIKKAGCAWCCEVHQNAARLAYQAKHGIKLPHK